MRIASWNMQGATGAGEDKWGKAVKLMHDSKLDVLCLQECGTPPPSLQNANDGPGPVFGTQEPDQSDELFLWKTWRRGSRRPPLYVYWVWGGQRVSLAIMSYRQAAYLLYEPPTGPRPAIGMGFADTDWDELEDFDVWTLHAKSGFGGVNDSVDLLFFIKSNSPSSTWMSLGDYNCAPGVLEGAGRYEKFDYVVCPPRHVIRRNSNVTHPGSQTLLDYMVRSVDSEEIDGVILDQFVFSDHWPVLYDTDTTTMALGKRTREDESDDDVSPEHKKIREDIFGSDSDSE